MKILSLPRGKGKTSVLCEMCIKMDVYLVVKNRVEADRVFNFWRKAGLRQPITYEDVLSGGMEGTWIKEVVIDNIDDFVVYAINRKSKLNAVMGSIDADFASYSELNEKAGYIRDEKKRRANNYHLQSSKVYINENEIIGKNDGSKI